MQIVDNWPHPRRRPSVRSTDEVAFSGAVCPTGWGFDPELGDEISKLAVETGVWPLKEAVDGHVRHTYIPSKFRPVEEYLKPQRRFRHLFKPQRDEKALAAIQANVDAYWECVRAEGCE